MWSFGITVQCLKFVENEHSYGSRNIRQKLHRYVDIGDKKLLKLLYAIPKEYTEDDDFEYEFSEEEIKVFVERRTERLSGENKTYSWKGCQNYHYW